MNNFSEVRFNSFKFQGVTIHPPSAYTSGNAYRSHLGNVADKLGSIYIRFLREFQNYFRYTLYCLRNDLLPSATIAKILLNKIKDEIE